jgi:acetoin utilization protein AcuB
MSPAKGDFRHNQRHPLLRYTEVNVHETNSRWPAKAVASLQGDGEMLIVGDLMTSDPETVRPDTTLRKVVERMKIGCCRQLPVIDHDGRLVGIITDRDVRLAMNSPIVLHGRWQDEELLDTAVAESCMTPDPVTVSSTTPAYRAAETLSAYKFGALPVVDDGRLVGIITVTDFLDRFAAQQPEASPGYR